MKLLDWLIVIVFLGLMTAIGFLFSRKNKNIRDYFLGDRSMPTWLVAFAVVGTSISAGTFVGSPQIAFDTNMTYIMLNFGAIIGGYLAAYIILPALYKANTITIYGYLGQRFGGSAKGASSVMFLLGQLLTSGSRLFIAAIAISVMIYNDIYITNLVISIALLGVISTLYTMAGGIKGLLYIDTIQILLVIATGIFAIVFLYISIPASLPEIVDALQHAPATGGGEINKLQVVDSSFSFSVPYNLMGALIACTIFKIAQYSTDQEFVQRQLTCKSPKKAAKSLIYSQIISLPIGLIFLVIGVLLYAFYSCPQLMGDAFPTDTLNDSRQVFPQYMFNHFPSGFLGLMVVGLLAAALSSFNSAINSMTSSLVSDIYIPLKKKFGKKDKGAAEQLKESRIMVAIMGLVLTAFAIVAAFIQEAGDQSLVDFALGIMSFSYAGLLGVFLCAVLTKRGNVASVIAALVTGCVVVFLLQPPLLSWWSEFLWGNPVRLAWPWWVVIGGSLSFLVCSVGKRKLCQ
ncbi:MAG: sodium:solute symporter [Dysgonamonadaceae bacterium]|jgi:SSS family transporter|nr:sodium:solute symporter [Dysgonamonadaceae bacterium]